MRDWVKKDLDKVCEVVADMISRSEKAREKFQPGVSQHTLQTNRLHALRVAAALIENERKDAGETPDFTKEDLERACEPVESLISKSEKAREKLKEGAWQHTMLGGNIAALYIGLALIKEGLGDKG